MSGRILLFAVLLALTLSSCGGGGAPQTEPSPSPGTSTGLYTSPDDRVVLKGTGYTFRIPEGWKDQTSGFRSLMSTVDRAVAEKTTTATLTNSVAVFTAPAKLGGSDPVAAARQLLGRATTKVKRLADKKIRGRRAVNLTGAAVLAGQPLQINQYYVVHGTRATVVWFAYTADTSAEDRTIIRRSVLSSWRWTKDEKAG